MNVNLELKTCVIEHMTSSINRRGLLVHANASYSVKR